jgi:uncharacterized SAM-binding protein YcdF (DUF218 family)
MSEGIFVWYLIPLLLLVLFFAAFKHNRTSLIIGAMLSCSIVLFWLLFFIQNYLSDILILRVIAIIPVVLYGAFLSLGVYIFIAFLIFNTHAILKREKRDLKHLLTLIFAVGLLLVTIVPQFINLTVFPQVAVYIIYAAYGLFIYYLFHLTQFVASVMLCNLSRPRTEQDYIIVLGCWIKNGKVTPILAKRLDKAIEFYNKQKAVRRPPKLILSGGKGPDESCSEAEAMEQYALEKGIPQEDLLLESKSVSTLENMKFSKEIMDSESGGTAYKCIYATNNYHLLRAGIFARKAGLKINGIGAKTAFYYLPNAILREYIAYIYIYLKQNIVFGVLGLIAGSIAVYYLMELIAKGS